MRNRVAVTGAALDALRKAGVKFDFGTGGLDALRICVDGIAVGGIGFDRDEVVDPTVEDVAGQGEVLA